MYQYERIRGAGPLKGLTPGQLHRLVALGQASVAGNGMVVPLARGGDDLAAVLEGIRTELAGSGGGLTEDNIKAIAQAVRGETGGTGDGGTGDGGTGDGGTGDGGTGTGTGTDDPEALRKLLQGYQMRDAAGSVVDQLLGRLAAQQQEQAAMLQKAVNEELVRRLGGKDLDTAIGNFLRDYRGGSRYAAPGADGNVLDQLAAGGTVQQPQQQIQVGDHRGVKQLEESKHPLGEYVRAVYRIKKGIASEAERLFAAKVMHKAALAEGTPSAGGYLVPAEYLPDILGLLREQAVLRRAGARVQNFDKSVSQTLLSTGASAFYTAENAQIQISDLTFGEAPLLSPKNLTAMVPASNYLLNDAAEAERIIREDMAEVMALAEDFHFLRGTGATGGPVGLRNKAGVTLDPVTVPANGFQISLMDLRRIRARFRAMNSRNPRPTWFFNTAVITYLETLDDVEGRPLLETSLFTIGADGISGTIDGLPFYATNQIPANLTQGTSTNATDLMLVDMNQVVIGNNQDLEIDVSTEASYWDGSAWVSAYQNNQSVFRGVIRHDIAVRRANHVIVQRGVLV